jgi:hypothetical protein
VDGEKFGPDKIRFTVGNRTYSMEELGKEEKARWPFGEPATLTILKPGGLKMGLHDVEVVQVVNPAYVPPDTFVGRTRRKITLVA